jgi:hypothetical protein
VIFFRLRDARLTTLKGGEDITMPADKMIADNEDEAVEYASDRGAAVDNIAHIEDEDEVVEHAWNRGAEDDDIADIDDEVITHSPESGTDDSLEDEDALLHPPLSLRGGSGSDAVDMDTTLRERAQVNRLVGLSAFAESTIETPF